MTNEKLLLDGHEFFKYCQYILIKFLRLMFEKILAPPKTWWTFQATEMTLTSKICEHLTLPLS